MKTTIRLLCLAVPLVSLDAMAVFRCVDDKGVTHIGDTPPASCDNVVMFEVSATGMVLRRIDPSLTPEQVKRQGRGRRARKEADKAAYEQKRKDLALLATYSAESEIDIARDRNIEPLTGPHQAARRSASTAIDKRVGGAQGGDGVLQGRQEQGKSKDGKEKAAPEAPSMLDRGAAAPEARARRRSRRTSRATRRRSPR